MKGLGERREPEQVSPTAVARKRRVALPHTVQHANVKVPVNTTGGAFVRTR